MNIPRPCARLVLPYSSGVQPLPLRNRDAALPAQARRQGHRARPLDDPAGLVHDEAQRGGRDAPGDLARVRAHASVRASRADGRLSRDDRAARVHALRRDRLRGGIAATQRRLAGRVRGVAHHPRIPREPRRSASRRVSDPGVRARHQSGLGASGHAVVVVAAMRRATSISPIFAGRPKHREDLATSW